MSSSICDAGSNLASEAQPWEGRHTRRCDLNGELFTDGHSHPWYSTPILRRLPKRAWRGLGRSFTLFKMTAGVMWSKGYQVTDAEVRELQNTLSRRDGLFYLGAAAGFAADHKAQGDRLDFCRLFKAYRDQFPILVGGSDEDPFEHRQIDLAEERFAASKAVKGQRARWSPRDFRDRLRSLFNPPEGKAGMARRVNVRWAKPGSRERAAELLRARNAKKEGQ
jgi:hypothetical protein